MADDRVSKYDDLTVDQLRARLLLAEDVLVLIGWSSIKPIEGAPMSDAAHQMWSMWCDVVGGTEALAPKHHRYIESLVPSLASSREAVRNRTLGKIRKMLGEDG